MATSNAIPSDIRTADEDSKLLETVRRNHDEAFLFISQALAYQEQQDYTLARNMYQKGLEKVDKALNVRCDRPSCNGQKWDDARKMQQKMRKTVQMIQTQLNNLPGSGDIPCPLYTPPEPFEMPPSYDEACDFEILQPRRSSCPVNGKHNNVKPGVAGNGERKRSSEVQELFCIPGGVQLFFVSLDGSVSSTTSLTSLHIYQFLRSEGACSDPNRPPAWLQIGSWTYPLVPGQSPALESAYGAFLFPDIGAGRDSAVGVILPPSLDYTERIKFQELLHQLTDLKEEKPAELKMEKGMVPQDGSEKEPSSAPTSFSDTLSRGLVTGAEYLSAGLVKGASMTSDLIHKGANKAKEKISPEDQPLVVDPRVREGLQLARDASGVALKATGFLVKRLGDLTVALGRQIAPYIREHGTKLLTSTLNKNEQDAQHTIDGVLTVAAGGLQGFSTVYLGLENAARTLAYSLSSETVNIVDHKYGSEAGEVVGNAVFSIGNLALTTHNVQSLGIKSVAKKTAKDAGKAVLKDYVENVQIPKK